MGRGWYISLPETACSVLIGIDRRLIECDAA
jgi:hypothetical protein